MSSGFFFPQEGMPTSPFRSRAPNPSTFSSFPGPTMKQEQKTLSPRDQFLRSLAEAELLRSQEEAKLRSQAEAEFLRSQEEAKLRSQAEAEFLRSQEEAKLRSQAEAEFLRSRAEAELRSRAEAELRSRTESKRGPTPSRTIYQFEPSTLFYNNAPPSEIETMELEEPGFVTTPEEEQFVIDAYAKKGIHLTRDVARPTKPKGPFVDEPIPWAIGVPPKIPPELIRPIDISTFGEWQYQYPEGPSSIYEFPAI